MKKVLIIAPHPDDETIGCGGTLLKHKDSGDEVSCAVVTKTKTRNQQEKNRDREIEKVKELYEFKSYVALDFEPTELDRVPMKDLVSKISSLYDRVQPEILYIPFINDIHSDHQITSRAALSSSKWFRSNSIKEINMYETLSETNLNFSEENDFKPNLFVDISEYLEKKLEILRCYKTEFGKHPFPRSEEAIKAQAILRGSQSGFKAAESFKLIFKRK